MSQKEGYINFEEYSQVGEPQKAERAYAWSTAIGLQAVDGLTVSQYLKDTAIRNIEGEITIDEARELSRPIIRQKQAVSQTTKRSKKPIRFQATLRRSKLSSRSPLVCRHSFPSIVTFSRECSNMPVSCELTILRKRNGCCVAIRYSMDGVKTCEWLWSMTWSKNDSSIIAD